MHRSLFKNLGAALALGLGLTAAPASAAGLLGERYVAVGYDYLVTESAAYDNGAGVTVFYNHPFNDHIDFGGSYKYAAKDGARSDVEDFSDQRLQFVVTAFGLPDGIPDADRLWVRLGAGLGMVDSGDDDSTGLSLQALLGTEYTLGEKGVLQPYVGWNSVIDDGETGSFVYGVQLVFDVAEKFAVNFRAEGDQRYNVALSIGGLFRF